MKNTIERFWQCIDEATFDLLDTLMVPEAKVILPNTREIFSSTARYIAFNKHYPGRWHADIERIHEIGQVVITTVRISSGESEESYYVTSYFTIIEEYITEIVEYWGDNGQPPTWRLEMNLSEVY